MLETTIETVGALDRHFISECPQNVRSYGRMADTGDSVFLLQDPSWSLQTSDSTNYSLDISHTTWVSNSNKIFHPQWYK